MGKRRKNNRFRLNREEIKSWITGIWRSEATPEVENEASHRVEIRDNYVSLRSLMPIVESEEVLEVINAINSMKLGSSCVLEGRRVLLRTSSILLRTESQSERLVKTHFNNLDRLCEQLGLKPD